MTQNPNPPAPRPRPAQTPFSAARARAEFTTGQIRGRRPPVADSILAQVAIADSILTLAEAIREGAGR